MSIEPITRSVTVKAPPAKAFDLFTSHMSEWWPKGKTPGKNPAVDLVIEPHVNGRWFERDAEGKETQWGDVVAWEPPSRLLLAWRLNTAWHYDPNLMTEVEITFAPSNAGGTVVTLQHRNLERFGADAEPHVAKISTGWPTRLNDFAEFANNQS